MNLEGPKPIYDPNERCTYCNEAAVALTLDANTDHECKVTWCVNGDVVIKSPAETFQKKVYNFRDGDD